MFDIPNSVKIGWKRYNIRFAEERLNSGNELFGQIDYQTCTITLRGRNTQEQDECTLIHEILHGVSEMYGLNMEEEQVERLANALYTFLVDNEKTVQEVFGVNMQTVKAVMKE
jgi:Zn-dependent peptidase ImmA (M78 family)